MADGVIGFETVRWVCPLAETGGCDWVYEDLGPMLHDGVLADIFGPGVMAVAAHTQMRWAAEREITRHAGTHSATEYITVITKLRAELAELRRTPIDPSITERRTP